MFHLLLLFFSILLVDTHAQDAGVARPPPYAPAYAFTGMGLPPNMLSFPMGNAPQDKADMPGAFRGMGVSTPQGPHGMLPMSGPPMPNLLSNGGLTGYASPYGGYPFGGMPMGNMLPTIGSGWAVPQQGRPVGPNMYAGNWPTHGGGGYGAAQPSFGFQFRPGMRFRSESKHLFNEMDTNANGTLSIDEFKGLFDNSKTNEEKLKNDKGDDRGNAKSISKNLKSSNNGSQFRFQKAQIENVLQPIPFGDAEELSSKVLDSPAEKEAEKRVAKAEKSLRRLEKKIESFH
eukprot:g3641.t1